VGWAGVKRGEYGRLLSGNWHVGGAVKECELEFSHEQMFSNDNMALGKLLEGPLPSEIAWMRPKVTDARGASRPTGT